MPSLYLRGYFANSVSWPAILFSATKISFSCIGLVGSDTHSCPFNGNQIRFILDIARGRNTFQSCPVHGQAPQEASKTPRHAPYHKHAWESCDRVVSSQNYVLHDKHAGRPSRNRVLGLVHETPPHAFMPAHRKKA